MAEFGIAGEVSSGGFFRPLGTGREVFEPLPFAGSRWSDDQIRGPAITGLLAHTAERAAAVRPDLQPVRASFELFRVARMSPTAVRATTVRQGRRIMVIDTFLLQNDEPVARAHTMFMAPRVNPGGDLWEAEDYLPTPVPAMEADDQNRLYRGDGSLWTADAARVANDTRKHIWQRPFIVVEGEWPSGFELVACACDMASLVVNWSTKGVQFINAEASVAISRMPASDGVGLATGARSAETGISVGNAVLYDQEGVLGVASATAIAQPNTSVHVGARDLD
jgi:hypothetical protein